MTKTVNHIKYTPCSGKKCPTSINLKEDFKLAKWGVFRRMLGGGSCKGGSEWMRRWKKIVIIATVMVLFIDLLSGRHWVEGTSVHVGPYGRDCPTLSSLDNKENP